MKSELTDDFLTCFRRLPNRIKKRARKNYQLWKADHQHPGVDFKRVGIKSPIYSVRIAIGWRALGLKQTTIAWFWAGSHTEYDRLLKKM